MARIHYVGGKAAFAAVLALFASVATARAQEIPPLPPIGVWDAGPKLASGASAPFRLVADAKTRERAETCLAAAVYYEAGDQALEGRQAVAQVVLNRLRHPSYPKSVCGVVYQGAALGRCQFTFACDGSLARAADVRGWREAQAIADQALEGFVSAAVGASTHYHTLWVHPAWSARMTPTRRIGAHQFYEMADAASHLTGVYAGSEPAFPDRGAYAVAASTQVEHPALIMAGAQLTPRAAAFSAWGLQIAVVTPKRSGVLLVTDIGGQAAIPPAPAGPAAAPGASGS